MRCSAPRLTLHARPFYRDVEGADPLASWTASYNLTIKDAGEKVNFFWHARIGLVGAGQAANWSAAPMWAVQDGDRVDAQGRHPVYATLGLALNTYEPYPGMPPTAAAYSLANAPVLNATARLPAGAPPLLGQGLRGLLGLGLIVG